jgi:hypothetical protein
MWITGNFVPEFAASSQQDQESSHQINRLPKKTCQISNRQHTKLQCLPLSGPLAWIKCINTLMNQPQSISGR